MANKKLISQTEISNYYFNINGNWWVEFNWSENTISLHKLEHKHIVTVRPSIVINIKFVKQVKEGKRFIAYYNKDEFWSKVGEGLEMYRKSRQKRTVTIKVG